MTRNALFSTIICLLLAACATTKDISGDSRFVYLIGHPVKTRVPLKLYQINYQLNSYSDRYELGGEVGGLPLVGIVPAGHSVLFDKAIRRNGSDASFERLEGRIKLHGASYPISYDLGLSGRDPTDVWKCLHYDFQFPVSIPQMKKGR